MKQALSFNDKSLRPFKLHFCFRSAHTMYLHVSAVWPAGASAESVAGGIPGKFESGHVQGRYTVTERE